MNILHARYVVEVAKTKSISKAAEKLYTTQPNISRAIKELEENLRISIFKRTSKGMSLTPDGEEFLIYAKRIVSLLDEVNGRYHFDGPQKQRFSICVPRASYISHAFTQFAKHITRDLSAEILYKETSTTQAMKSLVKEEYNLAVVRFQTSFDKYFKNIFSEKDFASENITEFSYQLLMSAEHPLAHKISIALSDLSDYMEISHSDPFVPSIPIIDIKKSELTTDVTKQIFVFERASQFELLENVPTTFMWVSPIPDEFLAKYNLVVKKCEAESKIYRDVLIYRKKYRLSDLDNIFIAQLSEAQEKFIK